MPRIREFDPDKALEKAMWLFWHKGYAETSMRDLVAYTGVAHAGLYNAFGSKREFFRAALKHHRDTAMTQLLSTLETTDSSRTEVQQFFEMMLDFIKTGNYEDGCFMVNTAIEFGEEAGDIMASVNAHMDRLVAAFQSALERARARNEVRADLDALATAEFLVSIFNGMSVLARAQSPYGRIERSVRLALKQLD